MGRDVKSHRRLDRPRAERDEDGATLTGPGHEPARVGGTQLHRREREHQRDTVEQRRDGHRPSLGGHPPDDGEPVERDPRFARREATEDTVAVDRGDPFTGRARRGREPQRERRGPRTPVTVDDGDRSPLQPSGRQLVADRLRNGQDTFACENNRPGPTAQIVKVRACLLVTPGKCCDRHAETVPNVCSGPQARRADLRDDATTSTTSLWTTRVTAPCRYDDEGDGADGSDDPGVPAAPFGGGAVSLPEPVPGGVACPSASGDHPASSP